MNYNAYLEYSDEPYDSTWLRSAPARFSLGQGEIGLVIHTMNVYKLVQATHGQNQYLVFQIIKPVQMSQMNQTLFLLTVNDG